MWSNQTQLVGLLPPEEVRCGRTTPHSLGTTLLASFPLHHRGLMWSNHPKLTGNYPVGLLPPSSQRFGVVEPPRTNSKLPCRSAYPVVRCGRTTPNSLETAL